jgi:hypothetical protein
LSETFIRLWHARARLDLTTVRGYLFTIARNLYLQWQRQRGRSDELPEHVIDPRPGPGEEAGSRDRTDTLGLAIFFSLLPFTFTFDGSGITFLLIRDKPVVGAAWLFTAAMLWIWHVQIRRRLRVAGL